MVKYFTKPIINFHEKAIKSLFDLNFGKDWKVYTRLFYQTIAGQHQISYEEFNPLEKPEDAGIKRKIYYGMSKSILRSYYEDGFEETKKKIISDTFRITWKGEILIDSSITDQQKLEGPEMKGLEPLSSTSLIPEKGNTDS